MPKSPRRPKKALSLFASALADKFFEPKNAIAKSRAEAAKVERAQFANWLERQAKVDVRAAILADKISACSRRNRCRSWACPRCGLAAQRLGTSLLRRFLRKRADQEPIYRISIVPNGSITPVGGLDTLDTANFARRLRRAFQQAGSQWVAGGVDFSVNEHKDGRYDAFWCPHFYGFTTADSAKDLKNALKRVFRNSDAIPRPVAVKEWDGRSRALRYAFKVNFKRRIGVDDVTRLDSKTGEFRRFRDTLSDRLRASEKLELALFLDEQDIGGRLVLRNAQLRHARGVVEICLSPKRGGGPESERIAPKTAASPCLKAKDVKSRRDDD